MRIKSVAALALGLALCGCGSQHREVALPTDTRQIKDRFDAAFEKMLHDYPPPSPASAKAGPSDGKDVHRPSPGG